MKSIITILVLSASVVYAGLPAPQFTVELQKTNDTAGTLFTQTSAVVTVTSKSGIGGAKLIRTGKAWPSRLTIRLSLKNLESFGMRNGIIHFNTSLKSPKEMPYWKEGKNERQSEKPDGTLQVTINRTDEGIDVVVPREMMEGDPEQISFGWIDAFRN